MGIVPIIKLFAKEMNYLRILLGLFAVALGSCVSKNSDIDTVRDVRGCCEQPTFSIYLNPLYTAGEKDANVTIEDRANGSTIRVGMGSSERSFARSQQYLNLKRKILTSQEWTQGRTVGYYFGPWMGPPRDILVVRADGFGLNLQGDKVPADWRREILRLASQYKKKANKSEQATPRNPSD